VSKLTQNIDFLVISSAFNISFTYMSEKK